MGDCRIVIDNIELTVPEGIKVIDAAKKAGINIPTLCYMKSVNEIGACRMCVVEINGKLETACTYLTWDGMVVNIRSPLVVDSRRMILEMLLSDHNRECTICDRNLNCELQKLSKDYAIDDIEYSIECTDLIYDDSNYIIRDESKCILCRKCSAVCSNVQAADILVNAERSFHTKIQTGFNKPLSETNCIECGQCLINCPVAAIKEKDEVEKVFTALTEGKYLAAQISPVSAVSIGEEFGIYTGEDNSGKITDALRKIGFSKVFGMDYAAGKLVEEQIIELEARRKNGKLPLISSHSTGWIKYADNFFPQLREKISESESPIQIMGKMIKENISAETEIKKDDIFVVAVVPCTASKSEKTSSVDLVLTTREAAKLIKRFRFNFEKLSHSDFDSTGTSKSETAFLTALSGGLAQAIINAKGNIESSVISDKLLNEIKVSIPGGKDLKLCIASGGSNIRQVCEWIDKKERQYDYVEFMACPGGCINGGGQPISSQIEKEDKKILIKRAEAFRK